MEDIFSKRGRAQLREFARSNVLLAFDYDGTLAPIVSSPDQAVMREQTRSLLQRISELGPCAVISGRAQSDVISRVNDVDVWEVIGNHGIEPSAASQEFEAKCKLWGEELKGVLGSIPGLLIENKRFSIAVHYRQCSDRSAAKTAILRAAKSLGDIRIITGKMVVNVLPGDAPHKGTALDWLSQRLGCDVALYVGDDVTDEDVFGMGRPDKLLTIRVGRNERSAAMYFIDGQNEIDALLDELLRHRLAVAKEVAPDGTSSNRSEVFNWLRED